MKALKTERVAERAVMAKQSKTERQTEARAKATKQSRQATSPHVTPQKQQSGVRRFFTVVICVIVALGLMLPTAGIGFASCSGWFG